MSIRMHRYDDGLTGLAAFCDVCDKRIEKHGYIVWNCMDESDWLVVHQSRCDPGRPRYDCSMPLDVEIVYLARSVKADLKSATERATLMAQI